ncbi:MAG: kinase, partial [Planctomycetota bacterium]
YHSCWQEWYVFDNSTKPVCPFCGTAYRGLLPVLNLYSKRGNKKFMPDNHRLMVYSNQYLYRWHANRRIFPNERISAADKTPVGYFVLHGGRWVFVNQTLPSLKDVSGENPEPIATNAMVELKDDQKLLLSDEDGGRLVHVQMVDCG